MTDHPNPKEVTPWSIQFPEDYPRVTPYLIVDDGAAAIDFYISVLGATERMRMAGPEARSGTPS